jgi:hypothetical protein
MVPVLQLFSLAIGGKSLEEGGARILGYLTSKDTGKLRLLCRHIRDAIAAYPWDDRHTPVYRVLDWRRCFPQARACLVARWKQLSAREVSEGLRGLRWLTLGEGATHSTGGWAALAGVTHFDIGHCLGINDEDLWALRGVQQLTVYASNLTDRGLHAVAGLKSLEITGGANHISDAGIASLAPQLASLVLSDMQGEYTLTDAAFFGHRLREVRLEGLAVAALTDAALHSLNAHKQLESIYIDYCTGFEISDAGLAALAGVTTVSFITLPEMFITDAGIAKLAGVERLWISGCPNARITDAGIRALAGIHALTLSNDFNLHITDVGLSSLAGIGYLDLSNNRRYWVDGEWSGPVLALTLEGIQTLWGIGVLDLSYTELQFGASDFDTMRSHGADIKFARVEGWDDDFEEHEDIADTLGLAEAESDYDDWDNTWDVDGGITMAELNFTDPSQNAFEDTNADEDP